MRKGADPRSSLFDREGAPAPLGAVKKLKNGEFCSRNALKTKDRNFAKINFLTAPYGHGSERSVIQ
jgi:hypothetical protein